MPEPAKRKRREGEPRIPALVYQPAGNPCLDLEVFTMSALRRRVGAQSLRQTYRHTFHTLLCITEGECEHVIDARSVPCSTGSVLVLRPGQVHRLEQREDWDGWMVLFRSELLMPRLGGLPDEAAARLERLALHLQPEAAEWHIVLDTIARLQDDTRRAMPAQALTPLLHHQLCALIHRLHGMSIGQSAPAVSRRNALMRFQAFQTLLEREHRSHHQVAWYAEMMGCSEKSLSRATLATVGLTAKAFIASQRVLEAKRLLIHTSRSVTAIGGSLGFDETTNFVKFFKREVGRTPSQFRASRPPP